MTTKARISKVQGKGATHFLNMFSKFFYKVLFTFYNLHIDNKTFTYCNLHIIKGGTLNAHYKHIYKGWGICAGVCAGGGGVCKNHAKWDLVNKFIKGVSELGVYSKN